MTIETAPEVKSIMPVSWLGLNVFHVTSTCEIAVLMRIDYRGWHACSSKEEVFDGGAVVASGSVDLLEAAAQALAMAGVPATLLRLQEERRAARMSAAKSWSWYIARGASSRAPWERNRPESASSSILPPCACPAVSQALYLIASPTPRSRPSGTP